MNARDILANGHKTVLSMVEGLSEEEWNRPNVCGVWSTKDIVAHLASFEWVLVDVLASLSSEGRPTPALDRFRESSEFNDEEVAARDQDSSTTVLDEYVQAHEQVMALVEGLPEETFRRNGTLPWYGSSYSLDDLLVYSFYGHKREHGAQIKLFRKSLD